MEELGEETSSKRGKSFFRLHTIFPYFHLDPKPVCCFSITRTLPRYFYPLVKKSFVSYTIFVVFFFLSTTFLSIFQAAEEIIFCDFILTCEN